MSEQQQINFIRVLAEILADQKGMTITKLNITKEKDNK